MKRRKFIKAIIMLAGAAVVAPKALFARPVQEKGLTLAKLVKAKRLLDAQAKSGPYYVYTGDGEETVFPFRFSKPLLKLEGYEMADEWVTT